METCGVCETLIEESVYCLYCGQQLCEECYLHSECDSTTDCHHHCIDDEEEHEDT